MLSIYNFVKMDIHVFPHPMHRAGRQSAECLRGRHRVHKGANRIKARALCRRMFAGLREECQLVESQALTGFR